MKIDGIEIELIFNGKSEAEVSFGENVLWWKKNMEEISVIRKNGESYKNVVWEELTLQEQTVMEMFP